MGRRKIEKYQEIVNKTSKGVTYIKRKKGVIKKAMQLSFLCGQEVMLAIHDPLKNKLVLYQSVSDFSPMNIHELQKEYLLKNRHYEEYTNEDVDMINCYNLPQEKILKSDLQKKLGRRKMIANDDSSSEQHVSEEDEEDLQPPKKVIKIQKEPQVSTSEQILQNKCPPKFENELKIKIQTDETNLKKNYGQKIISIYQPHSQNQNEQKNLQDEKTVKYEKDMAGIQMIRPNSQYQPINTFTQQVNPKVIICPKQPTTAYKAKQLSGFENDLKLNEVKQFQFRSQAGFENSLIEKRQIFIPSQVYQNTNQAQDIKVFNTGNASGIPNALENLLIQRNQKSADFIPPSNFPAQQQDNLQSNRPVGFRPFQMNFKQNLERYKQSQILAEMNKKDTANKN